MKMIRNYHTHTKRCGHASGEDEEYVLAAIKKGIKVLGFTDHIPYPDRPQEGIRQNTETMIGYLESINALKEKYKDQIEIHIGYEIEYLPEMKWWYEELLNSGKVEYFILGQHLIMEDHKLTWFHYDHVTNVKLMVDHIIEGVKSGLVKYICHPDFFMGEWNEGTIAQYKRLLQAAEDYNLPIELNMQGVRKGYRSNIDNIHETEMRYDDEPKYPYLKFWELASHYNVKVIIGGDYHDPVDILYDSEKICFEIVRMFNLNLIDKIDI